MNKKNRTLVSILLVLTIGLIGLTIAYFSNSTTIDNKFNTKEYGTTYIEEFVSPDNWLPGDTTNKTVTVTNSGGVDEAVRISLTEFWAPNDANATLTGWIHADGTKSNHTTENELATDERAAVINFTNNSDWTKVGDYYYYNYKLAPGETTDSLIESVTFNALTKLGDTCTPSTSNGTTTIICNSSGSDYDHATYKLTINIETVQYNKYKEAWGVDVATFGMKPMTAQQFISKANPVLVTNYTDGDVHEMYTFEHETTEQTPALTDYRYIGNDPYNYVYFNCDSLENQNSETCEVWRIIGVFDVEDEDGNWETRYKLIRGNSFADTFSWNSNSGVNSEWFVSSINYFLNNDYYNRENDFVNNGIKISSRAMISNSIYYLGGVPYEIYNDDTHYGSVEDIYLFERSRYVTDNRSLKWYGKVGLMYPSDMYLLYANGVDSTCYGDPYNCNIEYTYTEYQPWNNGTYVDKYVERNGNPDKGWIYNSNLKEITNSTTYITWFLTYRSNDYGSSFGAQDIGRLIGWSGVSSPYAIRPVLYLKENIALADGNGSKNNPYKLTY